MSARIVVWGSVLLLSILAWWLLLLIAEFIIMSIAYLMAFFIPMIYLGSIYSYG